LAKLCMLFTVFEKSLNSKTPTKKNDNKLAYTYISHKIKN